MKKILLAFAFCFAALSAFSSYPAEPRQAPTEQERARTVYIFHQPIVMLQAKFGLTTPEERVLRIRNTLRNFTEADVREPLSIVPVTRYNQQGRLIVMNGKPVMLLTEGDLDEGDDLTLDQAAQRVLARMEAQRMALRDQYDTGWLALSTVKTAAGLLALLLLCYGAWRSWRWFRRVYRRRIVENRSRVPQSWRRYIGAIEIRLYALLMFLLGVYRLLRLAELGIQSVSVDAGVGHVAGRLDASRGAANRPGDCLGLAGADDCADHFPHYRFYSEAS
ncbi:Small-conductance mechanosensitive channel [Enterobacter hormaechei]|nr:Small-conductance mechanosensitive channel [Enterobacter hormaechei]